MDPPVPVLLGSHLRSKHRCRSSSSTRCHLELTGPPLLPHLPCLLHPLENSGLQCLNNHTELAGVLDPSCHKSSQGREWSKEKGGTEVTGMVLCTVHVWHGSDTAPIWHSSALLPPCPTLTVIKGAKINRDGFIPAGIIPPPGVLCACRAAPEVGDKADKAAGNGNFPGREEITSFWGVTSHHPSITLFASVASLNNSWKQLLGVCISYTSAPLLTLGNRLMQSQFPK